MLFRPIKPYGDEEAEGVRAERYGRIPRYPPACSQTNPCLRQQVARQSLPDVVAQTYDHLTTSHNGPAACGPTAARERAARHIRGPYPDQPNR
jgi:hypothetical protein